MCDSHRNRLSQFTTGLRQKAKKLPGYSHNLTLEGIIDMILLEVVNY